MNAKNEIHNLAGKLFPLWQEKRANNMLYINFQFLQQSNFRLLQRACITLDIPWPKDVEYWLENQPMPIESGESLQVKHYHGLSYDTLRYVISSVVSVYLFGTQIGLYRKWIEGVLSHDVPLYALSPYFASFDEIKANFEKIKLNKLDEHDCFVFEKLYQILLENGGSIIPLVEELDRFLSIPFNELTLALKTKGRALNANEFSIKATAVVELQTGEKLKCERTQALQVLQKQRQLSLVNSLPTHTPEKGATYKLNLTSLECANIIENFDWQANDKINLTDLIDALAESRGGSSVVYARITADGDTEIWVEHQCPNHQAQHYHIATLKGLKNLPQDLNRFIEVGR